MNLNAIPVVGWMISLFFNIGLAIPFWFTWTYLTVGSRYAYFLPEVYHSPSFIDCVLIFTAIPIIKTIFVPTIATVTQNNTKSS